MLSLFCLHITISFVSLVAGFLFYFLIIRDDRYEKADKYRPAIFYLVTGLVVLTVITQFFALFSPVTIFYQAILLLMLLAFILPVRKKIILFLAFIVSEFKKLPAIVIITGCVTWCLILVLNAGPTLMDDTDSYHIQMVKWIQEYGTVPGLVNLHERFGFNSSWFSTISLFSFGNQNHNFYTALNAVISLWLAGYLLSLAAVLLKKNDDGANKHFPVSYFLVFIMALFSWPILRGNASTSNYDAIALLMIFVLFSETYRASARLKDFKFPFEWMIWPAFLITARLTNYPLLLLTLAGFFILWGQNEKRKLLLYSFICLITVVPFFIRNLLLSGYPFYPALYFDWFSVDWKASKEKTTALLHFIKYYNRVSTGIQDLDITEKLSFPDWILFWFKNMLLYNKIVFVPGIAGFLLFIFRIRRTGFTIRIFFLVILAQLISWLFTAPDPRFVYGCLFSGIFLLFASFENYFARMNFKKMYKPAFIVTAILIFAFIINKSITENQYRNWIYPAALPSPPIKNITIGTIELHIPEKILNNWNPRCYGTELPCVYKIDSLLEPRGTSIKDGFRLRK